MGHIRDKFQEFEKRGVGVVGVAAQDLDRAREYMKNHSHPFPLLIDGDRTVIKEYGVYVRANFESYNIARPAEFILDAAGVIGYIYIGSHQRDFPDDKELFGAMDDLVADAAKL